MGNIPIRARANYPCPECQNVIRQTFAGRTCDVWCDECEIVVESQATVVY